MNIRYLATVDPRSIQVWVTHMFVLSYLVGTSTGSGEGLVLQTHATSAPIVLARLTVD